MNKKKFFLKNCRRTFKWLSICMVTCLIHKDTKGTNGTFKSIFLSRMHDISIILSLKVDYFQLCISTSETIRWIQKCSSQKQYLPHLNEPVVNRACNLQWRVTVYYVDRPGQKSVRDDFSWKYLPPFLARHIRLQHRNTEERFACQLCHLRFRNSHIFSIYI